MSEFQVTQEKIHALLTELRSWDSVNDRYTLHELARMFDLDPFVVDRIARSEGFLIRPGDAFGVDDDVDPNATTLDLSQDDVKDALDSPDPDEDDVDTAVYRKGSSGEWERVEDEKD